MGRLTSVQAGLAGEQTIRKGRIMASKWTDGKPFVVTKELAAARWGSPFGCLLCDHLFAEGDTARWVYTNHGKWPWRGGNFFVCEDCSRSYDHDKQAIAGEAHRVITYMKSRKMMWERFAG